MTHLLTRTHTLEHKLAKCVGLLFFLLFITEAVFAQVQSPFTPISASSVNLSTAEQTQVNKVSALPHQGALQYATVGAFGSWVSDGGDGGPSLSQFRGKTACHFSLIR